MALVLVHKVAQTLDILSSLFSLGGKQIYQASCPIAIDPSSEQPLEVR